VYRQSVYTLLFEGRRTRTFASMNLLEVWRPHAACHVPISWRKICTCVPISMATGRLWPTRTFVAPYAVWRSTTLSTAWRSFTSPPSSRWQYEALLLLLDVLTTSDRCLGVRACKQGCGVGGRMSDSDLSRISDTDSRILNVTWMKFGCRQFCSN